MLLRSHTKDIKGPVFDRIYLNSSGQSRAVRWPSIANEIGAKTESGGLAVIH